MSALARRVSTDPTFLAYTLFYYQVRFDVSDSAVAAELSCPVAVLTNVRLCGAVRWDHFSEDCRVIADKFGLNVEVLERICWP